MFRRRFLPLLLLLAATGCPRAADDGAAGRIVRLQQACEAAARIDADLLAAPGTPGEAADALQTLDRLTAAEKEWDVFRAWAARRGTVETRAGLDRVWGDYGEASGALRRLVEAAVRGNPAGQPGLDAKRAEDYVRLHNRLSAACGALADWAARATPADFTSPAGPVPVSSPAPSPGP